MERIPVAGPWITQKEIDYVTDAVTNAWYSQANMYHERFEKAFAAYTGRKYAITLPSCTSGIHLAMAALGIGPGDEVIVPEITWIASASPVLYQGATPVFADVDPITWCMTPESFEACITPRTKAVMVVDLYGNMPRWVALLEVAKKHGIAVIEDSAQSIGAKYRNQLAGSFGDFSVFSFHGTKTLSTGEGGMLVTDNPELYDRCMILRDHGRDLKEKRLFWHTEVGYKYKMSSMQAALGLAQLERVEELIDHKRKTFAWYQEELDGVSGMTLNEPGQDVFSTYWMVNIMLDPSLGWTKERFMHELNVHNIDSRPFFYPLSQLPAFSHLPGAQGAQSRNPVAYSLSPYGVNLPSALTLTREQVKTVCQVVKQILQPSGQLAAAKTRDV